MTAAALPAPPRLLRTAAALMSSTVASAALGFCFWIVAARWFPPEAVGQISTAVSSMTLLAGIAQLNLTSMYGRFLPTAGPRARRMILGGYLAATVTAVALTLGFLALRLDAGSLGGGWGGRVVFAVGVVASAVFFIQDGVLTALRRATDVPVKNVISSGGKLLLLPLLPLVADSGVALLLAWVLPVLGVMLAVNGWILGRVAVPAAPSGAVVDRRALLGFVSAEYVNGLLNNAVAFLPPVLVAHAVGVTGSAYFYIPWTIGVAATTLLWNVVISFVVEATGSPGRLGTQVRRAGQLIAGVTVGGGLVLVAGASPLLSLLGGDYAAHGAGMLRLVGLSLPFTGVVLFSAAFAIMEKRMWRMVGAQGVGALLVIGGSWWGLPGFGLVAPAVALVVSQAVVAVALLPGLVRRYRAAQA